MTLMRSEPVHDYLAALRRDPHPRLAVIATEGAAEGRPIVRPDTGALLHTLALASSARRILEIGTSIGYSTLWLAAALPDDGMMISMECEAALASRARDHLTLAGFGNRVSVIVGDATRFLHKVAGPFDLIFQDSDKTLYLTMHHRLVELLRPGGVLVTDNINSFLADDPRLYTSFLQVGDGVSVSIKRAS